MTSRENSLASSALSQCGGFLAKAVFTVHVYGLSRRRRMLEADGLAEGEEPGSNVLHCRNEAAAPAEARMCPRTQPASSEQWLATHDRRKVGSGE
jgi:hypothetical protein